MASDPNRWLFTKDQIQNSPSRKCGIDYDKELSYRQQAATLIQEMGQKLQVTQLCINTAIVYMHRFYMFHSFTKFHRNAIASCALFLAAKVEEQPRKLEHVLRVAHMLMFREQPHLDPRSEQYMEQAQELITNENILLQTLGFDVAIDHPHTHVLRCCQLVRAASKDMAQASYFMATNSLHLTTMCLQYKPTVVASVCIHLVCKWSNTEIPTSSEGKDWFWYVDKTVMLEQLEQLTAEFLEIFNKCPSRLKRRVMQQPSFSGTVGAAAAPAAPSAGGNGSSSSVSDAAQPHHDSSSSHKIKTEINVVPKPGDRVPRPHDQRRDNKPVHPSSTSVPVSSASLSSSSAAGAAHRPAPTGHSSSHPPPHSGHSGQHHRSSSMHPDKTKAMHRPNPSQPVPSAKPFSSSSSSSTAAAGGVLPPHKLAQSNPPQPKQQHPQQPAKPQAAPSSQTGGAKSKSLFSPPHSADQSKFAPLQEAGRKPTGASSFNSSSLMDFSSRSLGLDQSAQQQQAYIPDPSIDMGFDADRFFQEKDSTWDFMNFDMGPGFSPPNEAIESMLNENKNNSSTVMTSNDVQQHQHQQQQSLSDFLSTAPPTVVKEEPSQVEQLRTMQLPEPAVEVSLFAPQHTTESHHHHQQQQQQSEEAAGSSSSDKKKKKKEKKEKKEKKKKNKEKDSEEAKEKKHKHKHKDKDKAKDNHAAEAEPEAAETAARSSLKVKIPTSRLKPESAAPSNGDSSRPELKLRISRDKLGGASNPLPTVEKESRKRDRTSTSGLPPPPLPPAPKLPRTEAPPPRERNGLLMDKVSSQQPAPPPPYPGSHYPAPPPPAFNQYPPYGPPPGPHPQQPFFPNPYNNYMYPFPPQMNYRGPSVPPLPRDPPPQAPPPPPPPSV